MSRTICISRIVQIPKHSRPARTGLHTGRLKACLYPIQTPITFLSNMMQRIDVSHPIRAGGHTVSATDTPMRVDVHDAVIALIGCLHRTHGYTNRVFTIVAQNRQKMLPHRGIGSLLHLFDPGSPHAQGNGIFILTGNRTGITPDAAAKVDQKSISWFCFFQETLSFAPAAPAAATSVSRPCFLRRSASTHAAATTGPELPIGHFAAHLPHPTQNRASLATFS